MICLCTCLAGLGPAGLLIIDGNNFLYRQSPRYGSHHEAGFPGDAHRAALVADAKESLALVQAPLGNPLPAPRIDLWFDGPEFRVEHPAPGLRVIDSGGKGKNRADRGILEFLRTSSDVRALLGTALITQDKGLAKRARRWVAIL